MEAIEAQRVRQAAFDQTVLEKVTRKDALRRGVKARQDFEVHVFVIVKRS